MFRTSFAFHVAFLMIASFSFALSYRCVALSPSLSLARARTLKRQNLVLASFYLLTLEDFPLFFTCARSRSPSSPLHRAEVKQRAAKLSFYVISFRDVITTTVALWVHRQGRSVQTNSESNSRGIYIRALGKPHFPFFISS